MFLNPSAASWRIVTFYKSLHSPDQRDLPVLKNHLAAVCLVESGGEDVQVVEASRDKRACTQILVQVSASGGGIGCNTVSACPLNEHETSDFDHADTDDSLGGSPHEPAMNFQQSWYLARCRLSRHCSAHLSE